MKSRMPPLLIPIGRGGVLFALREKRSKRITLHFIADMLRYYVHEDEEMGNRICMTGSQRKI